MRLDTDISAIKRSGHAQFDAEVSSPKELSGSAKAKDNEIIIIRKVESWHQISSNC